MRSARRSCVCFGGGHSIAEWRAREEEAEEVVAKLRSEVGELESIACTVQSDRETSQTSLYHEYDRALHAEVDYQEIESDSAELRDMLSEVLAVDLERDEHASMEGRPAERISSLCLLLKVKLALALAHSRDLGGSESVALLTELGIKGRCHGVGEPQRGRTEDPLLAAAFSELAELHARVGDPSLAQPTQPQPPGSEPWREGQERLLTDLRSECRQYDAQALERGLANRYRRRELVTIQESRAETLELCGEETQTLSAVRAENSRAQWMLELLQKELERMRDQLHSSQTSRGDEAVVALECELLEFQSAAEAAAAEAAAARELRTCREAKREIDSVEEHAEARIRDQAPGRRRLPPPPGELRGLPGSPLASLPRTPFSPDAQSPQYLNALHTLKMGGEELELAYQGQEEALELAHRGGSHVYRGGEALELAEVQAQNWSLSEEIAAAREQLEQRTIQREIVALRSRLKLHSVASVEPSVSSPPDETDAEAQRQASLSPGNEAEHRPDRLMESAVGTNPVSSIAVAAPVSAPPHGYFASACFRAAAGTLPVAPVPNTSSANQQTRVAASLAATTRSSIASLVVPHTVHTPAIRAIPGYSSFRISPDVTCQDGSMLSEMIRSGRELALELISPDKTCQETQPLVTPTAGCATASQKKLTGALCSDAEACAVESETSRPMPTVPAFPSTDRVPGWVNPSFSSAPVSREAQIRPFKRLAVNV